MNALLIDTHAHLDMSAFEKDRAEVISRASDAGVVNIISVGTDLESSKKAIELNGLYPGIYASAGIHPHEVSKIDKSDIDLLGKLARHPGVVAIGETGLDFFRDYSPHEKQIQALEWHLALSEELDLPVIIHCRQAEKEMLHLLSSWAGGSNRKYRGVIHCFTGGKAAAIEYLDMGFYLALGAYIGYPGSEVTHDVIRSIPRDKLLVETDCPFLPPQIYRGKRNEPAYIKLTTEILATIRGESYEETAEITSINARRLFRLQSSNVSNTPV